MGGSLSYRLSSSFIRCTQEHTWMMRTSPYLLSYSSYILSYHCWGCYLLLMFYCVLWCVSVYNNLNITCCCVIPLSPRTVSPPQQHPACILTINHLSCITTYIWMIFFCPLPLVHHTTLHGGHDICIFVATRTLGSVRK